MLSILGEVVDLVLMKTNRAPRCGVTFYKAAFHIQRVGASRQDIPGTGVAYICELLLVSVKTLLSLEGAICGLPAGARAPVTRHHLSICHRRFLSKSEAILPERGTFRGQWVKGVQARFVCWLGVETK